MSENSETQTDWEVEDKIRFLLENLIVDIGVQVTDDYKDKNGLYEGMSIKNVRSRNKYIKLFVELLADARREGFTKQERNFLIALLMILQTEFESDRAIGMRVDKKEEAMVNKIIATLREEES